MYINTNTSILLLLEDLTYQKMPVTFKSNKYRNLTLSTSVVNPLFLDIINVCIICTNGTNVSDENQTEIDFKKYIL